MNVWGFYTTLSLIIWKFVVGHLSTLEYATAIIEGMFGIGLLCSSSSFIYEITFNQTRVQKYKGEEIKEKSKEIKEESNQQIEEPKEIKEESNEQNKESKDKPELESNEKNHLSISQCKKSEYNSEIKSTKLDNVNKVKFINKTHEVIENGKHDIHRSQKKDVNGTLFTKSNMQLNHAKEETFSSISLRKVDKSNTQPNEKHLKSSELIRISPTITIDTSKLLPFQKKVLSRKLTYLWNLQCESEKKSIQIAESINSLNGGNEPPIKIFVKCIHKQKTEILCFNSDDDFDDIQLIAYKHFPEGNIYIQTPYNQLPLTKKSFLYVSALIRTKLFSHISLIAK